MMPFYQMMVLYIVLGNNCFCIVCSNIPFIPFQFPPLGFLYLVWGSSYRRFLDKDAFIVLLWPIRLPLPFLGDFEISSLPWEELWPWSKSSILLWTMGCRRSLYFRSLSRIVGDAFYGLAMFVFSASHKYSSLATISGAWSTNFKDLRFDMSVLENYNLH